MTKIFAWIIMILIIAGIIAYTNPHFFPEMKEKIENIDIQKNIPKTETNSLTIIEVSSKDNSISKCETEVEYYTDVSKKKYGVTISTSKINKPNLLNEFQFN